MKWTLRELYDRFDYYIPGITAPLLESLDEAGRRELLLQKADELFHDGRYNMKSECSLEMYMEPKAEKSLHDLKQISELTDDERTKLQFFSELKAFCYPLFRRETIDLSDEPFCMSDSRFSIKNKELRDFMYESAYMHLSVVLCELLVKGVRDSYPLIESVLFVSLSEKFEHSLRYYKDEKELRLNLNSMVDALWNADNHLEVGKQLGFSPLAQAIYDNTDAFICETYDYRQVNYAKEMAKWIEQHWDFSQGEYPEQEMVDKLVAEIEACAGRHDISFPDKQGTILYILGDTLGVSLFGKPEEDEDEWDLPDD